MNKELEELLKNIFFNDYKGKLPPECSYDWEYIAKDIIKFFKKIT